MTENGLARMILNVMRTSRQEALDGAIEICEGLAEGGHDATCCAQALRDLQKRLNHAEQEFDVKGHA